MGAPVDICGARILLPVRQRHVHGSNERHRGRVGRDARGCADVPLFHAYRHGTLLPRALPHEVSLHQPRPAHVGSSRDCGMQCPDNAAPSHARIVGSVRGVRHGQDTRHLRMHVHHTAVDYAQTRLCGVLPSASPCVAHINRGQRLSGVMVCLQHALALHALVHHPSHAGGACCAGRAHPPRACHAADCAAERTRLVWRGAVVRLLVADGLGAVLRRLARLVALAAVASGVRHGADNACRVSATHGSPPASLLRTGHVGLPLCGAHHIVDRRCRGVVLVRACP